MRCEDRHEEIGDQNGHERQNETFSRRSPDTFRAGTAVEAAVTRNDGDGRSEKHTLQEPGQNVIRRDVVQRVVPVKRAVHSEHLSTQKPAAKNTDCVCERCEQWN